LGVDVSGPPRAPASPGESVYRYGMVTRSLAIFVLCAATLLLAAPPLMAAGGRAPVAPMSELARDVYAQTEAMMRDSSASVGPRMLEMLLPVVSEERHTLLLGRLVVAAARIANADATGADVDALLARADGRADDAIAQFVAGVAAHYRGHVRGATRAAKKADYERAIRYLEPLTGELGHAPRLWIYLAISYRRTGRQAQAEQAIARAKKSDVGEDADVFYCEAEVLHGKDPRRALAAVDRYLAIMARNRRHGAYTAPHKEAAVQRMRRHLQAVIAGEEQPAGPELFDPIAAEQARPGVAPTVGLAVLLLLGPLGLVVFFKRRRRAATS